MCRISVFVPIIPVSQLELLPVFDITEVNGNSNKDGIGFGICSKELKYFKKSEEAGDIFCSPEVYQFFDNYSGQPLLCHTRIATTGKGTKNDKNAHPFIHDNLMGVHNGHFSNYFQVKAANNLGDLEVDSDVFIARLAQLTDNKPLTLEIIQECLDEFYGSFALAIYDALSDKIWLIVGTNDLYLYNIGYAYLINTTNGVNKFIDYSLNRLNLFTKNTYKRGDSKKLKNNTVFTIDKNGLHEVGALKVVETITYNYYEHYNPHYNPTAKLNNTKEIFGIIKAKNALMAKYKMDFVALVDLVQYIEDIPEYYSLSLEDVELLDLFLEWLIKYNYIPANLENHCKTWQRIYENAENEYDYALSQNPNFEIPFFLNSVQTINNIQIEDDISSEPINSLILNNLIHTSMV